METHKNKIYVTGLGSITALGYGAEAVWECLLKNQSCVNIKKDWKNPKINPQYFADAVDVAFDEEVKWDERFPPQLYSRLGILACKKAIEDAQVALEHSDNEIGLVIETSLGATASVEDYLYDLYNHGLGKISPIKFTKTVANTVLGDVSRTFKLTGPSSLIYNSNSISYGIDLIRKGIVDIVICGGVDHYTEFRILSEQENNHVISTNETTDSLNTISNEFKKECNALGDGAVFIVLESERSATKRCARKYAEIMEYHCGFDYKNIENTTKRSSNIISEAYSKFRPLISPGKKIAYLSAFTTNIQLHQSEFYFLKMVEKESTIFSLRHKAYTGDMKAASSVMGTHIASQILFKNLFPIKTHSENHVEGFEYAIVSTAHEGGGSSHFILKQNNSN